MLVWQKGEDSMSKRNHLLIMFFVFALLLCEINFTAADASYGTVINVLSAGNETQSQDLSPSSGAAGSDLGTPELIRRHNSGSLLSIRLQTRGKELQRLGIRILLLFVLVLLFLKLAFRWFKFSLALPENAIASSIILFFIHSKDGKK